MKFKKLVIALFLVYSTLQATDMPSPEEIDAALKECFKSIQTQGNEKPDHDAVDQCMSDKGFTKPKGGPGGSKDGQRQPMR